MSRKQTIILLTIIIGIGIWFSIFIYVNTYGQIELYETSTPSPTNKTECNTNNMNIIDTCMNYDTCCPKNNIFEGNTCYCNHPYIQQCRNTFTDKDQLKECCKKYNTININPDAFHKSIKQDQQSNIICSISSTKNLDSKCMELCQTNPQCKAYSADLFNCILFDNINPITNNKNSTTNYYIKKK